MTQIDLGWGEGPSDRYETLAAQFRPLFTDIAVGALERELNRKLPDAEIAQLKAARFGALRVPEAEGGFGATIPELANLLIELSAADSNITQALRVISVSSRISSTRRKARIAAAGRSDWPVARLPATPGRRSATRSRADFPPRSRRLVTGTSSMARNSTRPVLFLPTGSMSA